MRAYTLKATSLERLSRDRLHRAKIMSNLLLKYSKLTNLSNSEKAFAQVLRLFSPLPPRLALPPPACGRCASLLVS